MQDNEKKQVYLIDYKIFDKTTQKIIETNDATLKADYNFLIHKGQKVILEANKSVFPKVVDTLKDMKDGEQKVLELSPNDAYGVRNKELLRLVPFSVFKESNLRPQVGLTIDVGAGMLGTIRSVSGGRILVDFNSPYADHDIEFTLKKVKSLQNDEKPKYVVSEILRGLDILNVEYKDKNLSIEIKKRKDMQEMPNFGDYIKSFVSQYFEVDKCEVTFI